MESEGKTFFIMSVTGKGAHTAGRERCALRHVDAEKIDETIFGEIVKVLSNPGNFAKAWLKDLNFDEIKQKVERLRKKEKSLEEILKLGFDLITGQKDQEIREMYQKKQKEDEKHYQKIKQELRQAENEFNLADSKIDRLAEFEKAMKKGGRKGRAGVHFKTQAKFMEFLNNLPFNEKKRIVEAVVSSETRGKVSV